MNSHEGDKFGYDYFENGIGTRTSLYTDFKWIPQISFPIANELKSLYPNKSILDYGCAKGFIVYALWLLGVNVYGYDTSEYAIKHCKKEVRSYLFENKMVKNIDVVFAKDVFEHLTEEELLLELQWLAKICKQAFFIVPFGDDGEYRIQEYAFDVTHILTKNEEWWISIFRKAGFNIERFTYSHGVIKEKWVKQNPYGNGFFFLTSHE